MLSALLYKHLIDPLLNGVHQQASAMIPTGLNILDIACGTGSFAVMMSSKAKKVTGIDLAPAMINTAEKTKVRLDIRNLSFAVEDAADLSSFNNRQFDLATLSMAVHQFPPGESMTIIAQARRVAKEILFVDYASPLPENNYRKLVFIIERLAGRSHYQSFRQYQQQGGLSFYLAKNNLTALEKNTAGRGIFTLIKCK
jgi:ubiquinone/menaquinone biosynthesis C-methylase UbiE